MPNPLDGANLVAHWGFVYDYDDDRGGGFVSGEFLLRSDGVLLRRMGHSSTGSDESGTSSTTWTFHQWDRVSWWDGEIRPEAAKVLLRAQGYGRYEPGPVPIDADAAGPFLGSPELATPV